MVPGAGDIAHLTPQQAHNRLKKLEKLATAAAMMPPLDLRYKRYKRYAANSFLGKYTALPISKNLEEHTAYTAYTAGAAADIKHKK